MKTKKKILILGLGGVGYYLAKRLAHEGDSITVIEADRQMIGRADGTIDGRFIQGDAMNFSCWKEAGAEEMDYLIAVTDNDAVNIVASLIAHRCGIPHKIARVREMDLSQKGSYLTPEDLHIDLVIQPEELAAQEIVRLLKMRSGNMIIDLAQGQMQVLGTRVDETSPLIGRLRDTAERFREFDFRMVAISRDAETLIPGGNDEIFPRDQVFILSRAADLATLMEITHVIQQRRHRALIVGGGDIGCRVAELLENTLPITLIERDEHRAADLAGRLKRVELLHGDGADSETLIMAGLLGMDTVITATGDNEANIMTSVLAKHLIRQQPGELHGKEGKTITLVKREQYLALAAAMGSDIVLNKKVLAGNKILKHIRHGQMLSVAHLHGVDAEIVELLVEPGAAITRHCLSEIPDMKRKIIIGCVFQEGRWQTAVGATRISAGDRVIGICLSDELPRLEELVLG